MKLIYLILVFILSFNNSFAIKYNIGDTIKGTLDLNKNFKINLSNGEWEVIRKEFSSVYSIRQYIIGIGKVKNNRIVELIEVYEGELGRNVDQIDNIIQELVFHDKHDGCYERPEYYLVELYKKGSTHNCMVVRHFDVRKELNTPDSNWGKAAAAAYNYALKNNPEIEIPEIFLESEHSYFSRLVRGNWMRVSYFLDPYELDSPKLNLLTEGTSEFHRSNINRFPEHKKIMQKFISISSKRHIEFEKIIKSRGRHRLKLNKYLTD